MNLMTAPELLPRPAAAEPMLLTYKYRLNPEARQHRALERILEQQRQLYNAALEERILAYRMAGKTISEVEQSRSLTQIRADDPAFAGVQRRIQRETLRRLDRSYKAFFRRVKQGAEAPGFPRFKGREHFDGFGFDAFAQVKLEGNRLSFAGMPGSLKVNLDRPLPKVPDKETGKLVTSIKGVWFKREGRRSFCGFQVERLQSPQHVRGRPIGVDWGTSVLAALSTGETIPNPRPGEALAGDLRRAQRAVASKSKGSRGRLKARRHLQAVQRKIRNRRRNHLDKVSARLVDHFRTIAVEEIKVKGLMDAARPGETLPEFIKTRRNREVLDTAPYLLRQMLTYKARRDGAVLIAVDPKHTTPECHNCGRLKFKELTEEMHACQCGVRLPRKVNAAKTILNRALGHVPGARGGPVPGGAKRGDAPVCPGNAESGRPLPERRPVTGLPARTHGLAPRPPPGRLLTEPS